MLTVSLEEIQKDLPGYFDRVRGGETLVVTDLNLPVAEIKPFTDKQAQSTSGPRPHGLCAGLFSVPEEFNEPLPEDVLLRFEEG